MFFENRQFHLLAQKTPLQTIPTGNSYKICAKYIVFSIVLISKKGAVRDRS
jgi:hypothetical protein